MLKIFNKKKKNNDEYQVGDTVFIIGYPTWNFENKESKMIKIYKTKIISKREDKKGTRYFVSLNNTGLECEGGGFKHFNSLDEIKKAINEFCDSSFMDFVNKID